jgi:plastocyanin
MFQISAPRLTCAIALAALCACGASNVGGSSTQAFPEIAKPNLTTVKVKIQGFAYSPAALKIKVGTSVIWTNYTEAHTVTSKTSLFNSGSVGTNQSWKHTFKKTGKFPYFCLIHPYMIAQVVVTK